jgi:hypothetical protein
MIPKANDDSGRAISMGVFFDVGLIPFDKEDVLCAIYNNVLNIPNEFSYQCQVKFGLKLVKRMLIG